MDILDIALKLVAALVGFPAFLAAAINILKQFGLPDGTAAHVSFGAHLLVYVGVAIAAYLGKVDILQGYDAQLGEWSKVLLAFLAFITSLSNTRAAHYRIVGLPLIGKSNTREAILADAESMDQETGLE